MSDKKVIVVYYSMYGHIKTLAKEVVKGLERAGGFNIFKIKTYLYN